MPVTLEQLTRNVLTLPESERAHLAQVLLQSLEPSTEERGVQQAWEDEIARRLERVKQGAARGKSADKVFADIRAQHQK